MIKIKGWIILNNYFFKNLYLNILIFNSFEIKNKFDEIIWR